MSKKEPGLHGFSESTHEHAERPACPEGGYLAAHRRLAKGFFHQAFWPSSGAPITRFFRPGCHENGSPFVLPGAEPGQAAPRAGVPALTTGAAQGVVGARELTDFSGFF